MIKLTVQDIHAIVETLKRGERVEVIPGKNDTVKIMRVKREQVNKRPGP